MPVKLHLCPVVWLWYVLISGDICNNTFIWWIIALQSFVRFAVRYLANSLILNISMTEITLALVVLIYHYPHLDILFCSWLVNLNSPRITLRLCLQVFCGDWKEYSKVFSFRGDSNWLGFSKVCRPLSLQLILLSFRSNAEIGSTKTTLLFMIYNIKKLLLHLWLNSTCKGLMK